MQQIQVPVFMNRILVRLTLFLAALCAAPGARGAERPVFELSAPLTVAAGSAFNVEFTLNAKPDDNSFKAPSFEGFDVLAGPAVSRGSSMSFVGGQMSKSVRYSYTFVLLPRAAGNVTIGAAEISVGGERLRTQPQPIEVVDEGAAQGGASARRGEASDDRPREASDRVAEDDVLLRAVVSKRSVFKNEPLHVTYKLYTRVPFVDYSFEASPTFNGFWAQDLVQKRNNVQSGRETFNGRVYETYVLGDWLLYPQQAGQLTIEPMGMTVVAQVVVQSRNRDPFFGGGHEVYNVPRKVRSQPMTVTVKPLPAGAPADFNGAVGDFSLEAVAPDARLAANSGATYTLRIAGTGNLTFVQAPTLALPGSFEQYNVRTTESINASAAGISGYRQFEYPFIARAEGEYDIAPVTFSFFDPSRMQYRTLETKPLTLEILPDEKGGSAEAVVLPGRGLSKEEVRLLGEDIRFIKMGDANLRPLRTPLLFSGAYWGLLALLALLFAGFYAALRRRILESQNTVLVRGRRANKVALQRFRAARRYMEQQERHAFYEEMLRALWGYMSDKFNIPVANLTKENVREELHKRGISQEESQRFTAIITRCDEAQYAPSATSSMNEVYASGIELVSEIEAKIKR